ncbi:Pyruvate/Phosphoenolpyruvate kinase-like domain-containing protein, partial [Mycena latifolia]
DTEHTPWSPTLLVECIQDIIHESAGRMVPVVRVPSKTSTWCMDAGAGGIIVPHLETVEEMKAVIAACRFPPIGERSFPPAIFIPGVTDITPEGEDAFSLANKHVAIIPQIESRIGFQNLEEISQLPEISAFMVGVADLRMEMGLPLRLTEHEAEFSEIMKRATSISKECDVPILGIASGADAIKRRIDEGFRIIMCCKDLHTLALGMVREIKESKDIAEEYMLSKQRI